MSTVRIDIDFNWDAGEDYYIKVDEGFVVDTDTGLPNTAIVDPSAIAFTTLAPPLSLHKTPEDDLADFQFGLKSPTYRIDIQFPEDIFVGTGNITLYETSGEVFVQAWDVTTDVKFYNNDLREVSVYTTIHLTEGTSYYVILDDGSFLDENCFSLLETDERVSADIVVDYNWQAFTDTPTMTASTFSLGFCEAIQLNTGSGNEVRLYETVGNVLVETFDIDSGTLFDSGVGYNDSVRFNTTLILREETDYYANADRAIVIDENNFGNKTIVQDDPSVTFTFNKPYATGPLIIQFDRNVFAGSGDIHLHKVSDDSLVETINASAATFVENRATFDVTVAQGIAYYVLIENTAIVDIDGIAFDGYALTTDWNINVYDGPIIASSVPGDNDVDIDLTTFTITFNDNVSAKVGDISVYETVGDVLVDSFDITSDVSIVDDTITISWTEVLDPNTDYYVTMPEETVKNTYNYVFDTAMDNTSLNFTTHGGANILSSNPADDDASAYMNLFDITFDETPTALTGNFGLYKTAGSILEQVFDVTTDITIAGDKVTLNTLTPIDPNTDYYVTAAPELLLFSTGVKYEGFTDQTTWNFTTGNGAIITSSIPVDNSSTGFTTFEATYDQTITANVGTVNLYETIGDVLTQTFDIETADVTIAGNNLSFNNLVALDSLTDYYVKIDSDIMRFPSVITYPGITNETDWNFTTVSGAVATSFSPPDDSIHVNATSLDIFYNKNITANVGSINLYKTVGDVLVESFDVTTDVTILNNQATVTMTSPLEGPGVDYYVLVDDDIFVDTDNLYVLGWTDKTIFNFTSDTNPLLVSVDPVTGTTDLYNFEVLTLNFDSNVKAGTGSLTIYRADHSAYEVINVTTLNYAGTQVTTDTIEFEPDTSYYVQVDAGGILETDHDYPFAGISDTVTFEFSIAERPYITSVLPIDDSVISKAFTFEMTYNTNVVASTGSVHLYKEGSLHETLTSAEVIIVNNLVTANFTLNDDDGDNAFYVLMDYDFVQSSTSGMESAAVTNPFIYSYTTVGPVITETYPLDNATNVSKSSTFELTFNQVMLTTSNPALKIGIYTTIGDTLLVDFNQTEISGFGTNVLTVPSADLAALTEYYMLIDDAFAIGTEFEFLGISSTTEYSFTSAEGPAVIGQYPVRDTERVEKYITPVLVWDEAVSSTVDLNKKVRLWKATSTSPFREEVETYVQTDFLGWGTDTITHSATVKLDPSENYWYNIDAGFVNGDVTLLDNVVNDHDGNPGTQNTNTIFWSSNAPYVSVYQPVPAGQISDSPLVINLEFEENYTTPLPELMTYGGTGDVKVYETTGDVLIHTYTDTDVTGWGTDTLLFNNGPLLTGITDYYIKIDEDFMVGTTTQFDFNILTSTEYTFDTVDDPVILTTDPVDGTLVDIDLDNGLTFTFTNTVSATGETGTFITLYNQADTPISTFDETEVTGYGTNTLTTASFSLPVGSGYYVLIEKDFIVDDLSDFKFVGVSDKTDWNFSTDDGPAILSTVPLDNATEVNSDVISITYDGNVTAGTGTIRIYKTVGDVLDQTFDVTTDVTIVNDTVTLDGSTIEADTSYYILMDKGVVTDTNSIDNRAITDSTDWNFSTTTLPVISSTTPVDNATGTDISTFDITFDQNVSAGTGNFYLYETVGNVLVQTFDVTTDVTIVGATMTIDTLDDELLNTLTEYYVLSDAGAIVDGIFNAENITSTTYWSFTTGSNVGFGMEIIIDPVDLINPVELYGIALSGIDVDWGNGTWFHYADQVHTNNIPTGQITVRSTVQTEACQFKLVSVSAQTMDFAKTRNVTNMQGLCLGQTNLTTFSAGDTSNVTDFNNAWDGCTGLTSFPAIDVSSGGTLTRTWWNCTGLTSFSSIILGANDFDQTWFNCTSLTSFPALDTSNVQDFEKAWDSCSGLTSFPSINTTSATLFFGTWSGCSGLTSFPGINTSIATDFGGMFANCSSLVCLTNIDTTNQTNTLNLFLGCTALTTPDATDQTAILAGTSWTNPGSCP